MRPYRTELDKYRVRTGPMASDNSYGNNGAFIIPHKHRILLACVVSDQEDWDHVSIHVETMRKKKQKWIQRTPTWDEIVFVKDMFFRPDEWEMQFLPGQKDYINDHNYTLHIWRPHNVLIPKPPIWMV